MRKPIRSWSDTLAKLGLRWAPAASAPRSATRRTRFESLEDRQLMTASTFSQDVLAASPIAFWPMSDSSTANGATVVSLIDPTTYNGIYQSGNQAGDGVTSGPAAYLSLGTAAYFHNTSANTSLAASDAVITPNSPLKYSPFAAG